MVENSSKVSRMVGPLFRVSGEIIEVSLDNPYDVMECIRHGPLESGSNIFKAKGHFLISEGTQGQMKAILC